MWGNLGAALRWAGDSTGSRAAYVRAVELAEARRAVNRRDPQVLLQLAEYRAAIGDHRAAEALLSDGLQLSKDRPALQYEAALTYAYWLNNPDKALDLLRKALEGGQPWRALERSPSLDRLRGDSRFKELRRYIPRQTATTKQGG